MERQPLPGRGKSSAGLFALGPVGRALYAAKGQSFLILRIWVGSLCVGFNGPKVHHFA